MASAAERLGFLDSAAGALEHVGRVHDGVVDRFGANQVAPPETVVPLVVVVVRAGASAHAGCFIGPPSGFDDIDAGVAHHRVGSLVVGMSAVARFQTVIRCNASA